MNLLEAVKSGKPFKRKKEKRWYKGIEDEYCHEAGEYCFFINESPHYGLDESFRGLYSPLLREDILADDWEIKEDRSPITALKSA